MGYKYKNIIKLMEFLIIKLIIIEFGICACLVLKKAKENLFVKIFMELMNLVFKDVLNYIIIVIFVVILLYLKLKMFLILLASEIVSKKLKKMKEEKKNNN